MWVGLQLLVRNLRCDSLTWEGLSALFKRARTSTILSVIGRSTVLNLIWSVVPCLDVVIIVLYSDFATIVINLWCRSLAPGVLNTVYSWLWMRVKEGSEIAVWRPWIARRPVVGQGLHGRNLHTYEVLGRSSLSTSLPHPSELRVFSVLLLDEGHCSFPVVKVITTLVERKLPLRFVWTKAHGHVAHLELALVLVGYFAFLPRLLHWFVLVQELLFTCFDKGSRTAEIQVVD